MADRTRAQKIFRHCVPTLVDTVRVTLKKYTAQQLGATMGELSGCDMASFPLTDNFPNPDSASKFLSHVSGLTHSCRAEHEPQTIRHL
jgi:hypothetical protein